VIRQLCAFSWWDDLYYGALDSELGVRVKYLDLYARLVEPRGSIKEHYRPSDSKHFTQN
jgi:hypothetical protein